MGIFDHKPKVSVEDTCRDFYDTNIFKTKLDFWDTFSKTFLASFIEADNSLNTIPFVKFKDELTALRIELFSLAWCRKLKRDESAISQSSFTRQYLEEHGHSIIWEMMGEYNTSIAKSTTIKDSGESRDNLHLALMNKKRFDYFKKLLDPNRKEDENYLGCLRRVVNRFEVDISKPNCAATIQLTSTLADRLGCDTNINSEALFRMQAMIFGLYEGAKEALVNMH